MEPTEEGRPKAPGKEFQFASTKSFEPGGLPFHANRPDHGTVEFRIEKKLPAHAILRTGLSHKWRSNTKKKANIPDHYIRFECDQGIGEMPGCMTEVEEGK